MTRIKFLGVSLLATSVIGCGDMAPGKAFRGDMVEYVCSNDSGSTRVLLLVEGAARIDFKTGQRVRTVLLPTDPKEVERLVRTIDALLKSSAGTPVTRWEFPPVWEKRVVIRCRRKGQVRSLRMAPGQELRNFVWKGVIEETETVGLVGLARAVHAFENGELRLKQGEHDAAFHNYDKAVRAFERWAHVRCRRYGGVIYEPEVAMEFRYPVDDHGTYTVVKGVPEKVMELPGISQEWAIKLLRYGWQEYTKSLIVSRSGDVLLVGFAEEPGGPRWTWGLPIVAIPPEVVDLLKRGDWDRLLPGKAEN